MLLIHDIKYSDLLYNWKELQPGESGTITVSYEAEQPGDFYRTNKEGGNDKSSKFGENNKRVGNHPFREMVPDERTTINNKMINP